MNMIKHLLTSIKVIILTVVCSASAQKNISKITGLRAVTEFDDIDELHYSLYKKILETGIDPQESIDPSIKIMVKQEICEKVFSSPYFKILHQVESVDVEKREIARTLYNHHRPFFNFIFKPVEGFRDRYQYLNPYTSHTFLYKGERLREYMFVCMVRALTGARNIEPYLVSREYNINLVSQRFPIAGRFIFTIDDGSDWKVQALAEEYAISSELFYRTKTVEYLYITNRQVSTLLGPAETDPVCKLPSSSKLRLCVSIFTSKILRRKYEFTPDINRVEEECVKKRVSFAQRKRVRLLFKMRRKYFNKGKNYEEWMIGCNGLHIGSNDKVTYYVSRGDVKNSVFAYKYYISDEKILVKHYFRNVSVVDSTTVNMLDLGSTSQKEAAGDVGDINNGIEADNAGPTSVDVDSSSNGEEIKSERDTSLRRNLNHPSS